MNSASIVELFRLLMLAISPGRDDSIEITFLYPTLNFSRTNEKEERKRVELRIFVCLWQMFFLILSLSHSLVPFTKKETTRRWVKMSTHIDADREKILIGDGTVSFLRLDARSSGQDTPSIVLSSCSSTSDDEDARATPHCVWRRQKIFNPTQSNV